MRTSAKADDASGCGRVESAEASTGRLQLVAWLLSAVRRLAVGVRLIYQLNIIGVGRKPVLRWFLPPELAAVERVGTPLQVVRAESCARRYRVLAMGPLFISLRQAGNSSPNFFCCSPADSYTT
jgi:hypothetical protein